MNSRDTNQERSYLNTAATGADGYATQRRQPRRATIHDHPYLLSPTSITSASNLYRGYKYGARSIARGQELLQRKDSKKATQSVSKDETDTTNASQRLRDLVKQWETHDIQRLLLVATLMIVIALSIPSYLEPLSKPSAWKWSPDRNLGDRQCVMNLFIEKQPPDEYNPDYKDPKKDPRNKNKRNKRKLKPLPPEIAPGTYRTKGQVHVISRFIEAVAGSFRSKTSIQQSLIFAGSRDGGHLAEIAMKHWPPRGAFRTKLHIVAADPKEDKEDKDKEMDPLQYDYLNAIEERFKGNRNVHIYDRDGVAGLEMDDDEAGEMESRDIPTFREKSNATALGGGYLDFTSLFANDDHVIPYMHVDGEEQTDQMEILESAKPLLQENTIVAVGIEHSPDLDAYELLSFFSEVNYKLFFLGSRQVARIDHLCEEILDDIIRHPSITPFKPTPLGDILGKLGLVDHGLGSDEDQEKKYPPFFVAMPKGRINKEEMTIQHMYDLFGGYGGGGGQIKTANDRKAPGK
jgi:hypothetical protein